MGQSVLPVATDPVSHTSDETSMPAPGLLESCAVQVKLSVLTVSGHLVLEDETDAALNISDVKLLLEKRCGAPTWLQRILMGDAILRDENNLGTLAVGSDTVQLLLIILTCRYGIREGRLTDGAQSYSAFNKTDGECQNGLFVLGGGVHQEICYPFEASCNNFTIESHVAIDVVDGTAVTFVFWDGERTDHIGLEPNKWCDGAHWGRAKVCGTTPLLRSGQLHRILVKRVADSVSLYVDGSLACKLPMDWSVSAVGWRPWGNTIRVESLGVV